MKRFRPIGEGELRLLNAITSGSSDQHSTMMLEWLAQHDRPMRLASLFGYLKKLERTGLIVYVQSVRAEQGGRPARVYRATQRGHYLMELARQMAA